MKFLSVLAREGELFAVALQFLTRLPVPVTPNFEASMLDRAAKYFPLVGWVVGVISAGVLIASFLVLPGPLHVVLAVSAGVIVTGALHEDGLADTADGLGGGRDAAHRLEIMKDSRTGTYGVLALILALATKFSALESLSAASAAMALIAAHAAGRLATVFVIFAMPYAGDPGRAKVAPLTSGQSPAELAVAIVLGVLPALVLLPLLTCVISFVIAGCAGVILARVAQSSMGGWTGDVVGAIEQVVEISFLVAVSGCMAGSLV